MRCLWTLALLSLFADRLASQWEPEISGYVVTMPAFLSFDRSLADSVGVAPTQLVGLTRFRLRPSLSMPWNALLEVEGEVSAVARNGGQYLIGQGESVGRQVLDLRWTLAASDHVAIVSFIDRLVYRQRWSWGELAVGRQRISWGTGRIWNPTDLFNPLNPANFAKIEKDGADAVSAKVFLGTLSDVQAVWNPANTGPSNFGARLRTNSGTYDIALLGGYFDTAPVTGGDLAGNLGPMGVRAEVLYAGPAKTGTPEYVKAIAGVDQQFSRTLYGLLEYQFNGQGTTDKAAYDLEAVLEGSILNVARHYVAAMATYQIHPLVTLSLMGTVNLNDGSQFYSSLINYSAGEELLLGGGLQLFVGDRGDEFWYYPLAAYLTLDYTF